MFSYYTAVAQEEEESITEWIYGNLVFILHVWGIARDADGLRKTRADCNKQHEGWDEEDKWETNTEGSDEKKKKTDWDI